MAKEKQPKKPKTLHGLSAEDTAKLAAVLAGLEKSHGAGCIRTLDSAPNMGRFEYQIPSGSIGLDIAIGPMKKLPSGTWQTGLPPVTIEVYGPESCGKTTLTLCEIANTQSQGGLCAFIDMEHALDPLYAKFLGVQMDKLYWAQPKTGDEALQIAETLLKSGMFRLIVIDSVAALVPAAELAGEVGDSHVGQQPRLMSQFFRMIGPAMGQNCKTTLICVNQIREKIGVKFGSPETTPGGRALKFAASLRFDIRRVAAIREGGGEAEDDGNVAQQIGHMMQVKVVKNKVGPPFRISKFPLIYGKGIDILTELIDLAILHGAGVTAAGSWYYIDDKPYQGKAKIYEYLQGNPARAYRLYDDLLTLNMAKMGYNSDGTPIPGALEVTESQHAQFEPPTEEEIKAHAEPEVDGEGTPA